MKKTILIMIILLSSAAVMACDICGCGVGGNYLGILPDFKSQIFGIRYRTNSLRTHIGVSGNTTYLTTDERYRTLELWAGWNIGKFRLMASIPYSFNERENGGNTLSKSGIGDVSLTGYYKLLDSRKAVLTGKLLVQSLYIGGGIKLPTGKYNPADKTNTSQNTNLFQLGTGSLDFSVNAMYDIRLQDAGLNVSASYKMNTSNKYEYSYGNKFNGSAQAYYKFNIRNKVTIAPNAGILYEKAKQDIDNKFIVDISGGNLLLGSVGMEVTGKKISAGISWQSPLSQNLAGGFVRANNRAMMHVSFTL